MNIVGKVVIVTGASSGIGAKTAELFCRKDAHVALIGRNETKLKSVSEKCSLAGGRHMIVKADVSSDDDAKRIVNDTLDKFGKIDVLVNNAAAAFYGNILDGTFMESYDKQVNTNLRAVMQLTSLAAPHLVKTKGSIVNISSIAGMSSPRVLGAYAVVKAAITQFSKVSAAELAPHGVRVNTISPGPVYTDIIENSDGPISFEQMRKATALQRVSDADEVADLIVYLASEKARGITGANFVIDNGALLK